MFIAVLIFEVCFLIGIFIAKRTDIFLHDKMLRKYRLLKLNYDLLDILYLCINVVFITITLLFYFVCNISNKTKIIICLIFMFSDLAVNVIIYLLGSQIAYKRFLKMLQKKLNILKSHNDIATMSAEQITRQINLLLDKDSCTQNDVLKILKLQK